MLRPLGLILLILLTSSSSVFGQPKGVALRDKNIILIHEDDKNIFNLVSTSVKPYQDTGYVFTFDLRQDYKVVDKTHPEDVGLNLRYMVFCDKQRIAPTMVQHSRGDGMLGMIDPPNFNGAIDMPEPGTYQRKVLDYVCNAQLGDGYKKIVVTTQAKQVPVTIPPPVLTSQNKSTVSPDGQAKGAPIQTDIGKLIVVYQPDADAYYPSFSKRKGEQGEVVVRLIIDEGGDVEDIALLKSSGYPRLDRAASDIGRRYRFKPFLVNGSPSRISTNLLIKFNLKEDDPKGVKPKFEKNPLTSGG